MKNQCPNKAAWGKKATRGGFNRDGNSGGNGAGKRSRPYGKLNCTNLEEVNDSKKTVIGTLQILSHPGKVLFGTGATTSFISQEFVDLYGLSCNKLELAGWPAQIARLEMRLFQSSLLVYLCSY
jgi:hypothetical protein